MPFSKTWIAFAREAAIAGQSLSAGLTSLRKANYAQTGLYSHAFFNLTIGLERTMKIIYLVDYALQHNGTYPTEDDLRGSFHHDLEKLLEYVLTVRTRLSRKEEPIETHIGDLQYKIVGFLSEFAKTTRYYNLDYLVGAASQNKADPITRWYNEIGSLILDKHYKASQRERDTRFATEMGKALGDNILVLHTAEDGTPLTTFEDASLQTAKDCIIQKYGTFYCATIARFLYMTLFSLDSEVYRNQLGDVPCLYEFFFPFMNDDKYLLSRKTFPPQGQ